MIFSIKFKWLVVYCALILCVFGVFFMAYQTARPTGNYIVPNSKYCIVIDAGHGGIDGGSVGRHTGVFESYLNLTFAKNLANQFKEMGLSCVLTRSDNNGLYDSNAKSLKKSDMIKRKEIIEKSNADIVISIHMDSFPISSTSGAQAYYKKDNKQGKVLASCVQKQLLSLLPNAKKSEKVGDYYLVNCTNLPSVLVECGFLSNKEEEILLQTKEYQDKVCYSIMTGVIDFLNTNK